MNQTKQKDLPDSFMPPIVIAAATAATAYFGAWQGAIAVATMTTAMFYMLPKIINSNGETPPAVSDAQRQDMYGAIDTLRDQMTAQNKALADMVEDIYSAVDEVRAQMTNEKGALVALINAPRLKLEEDRKSMAANIERLRRQVEDLGAKLPARQKEACHA